MIDSFDYESKFLNFNCINQLKNKMLKSKPDANLKFYKQKTMLDYYTVNNADNYVKNPKDKCNNNSNSNFRKPSTEPANEKNYSFRQ